MTDMVHDAAILRTEGLEDWRKLAQALHGRFLTGDIGTGLRFVTAIAGAAEEANHHPEMTLTGPRVDLRLITEDAVFRSEGRQITGPWVTELDVDLARRISTIAREQGILADPRAVVQYELGLDTADATLAGPFWAALLTGSTDSILFDDVRDPTNRVPNLWFQETEAHDTPRQRFHIDLWLPTDVADERIAAAVAAGGTIVDDSEAPSFTVLADQEGNRACVCCILDR